MSINDVFTASDKSASYRVMGSYNIVTIEIMGTTPDTYILNIGVWLVIHSNVELQNMCK